MGVATKWTARGAFWLLAAAAFLPPVLRPVRLATAFRLPAAASQPAGRAEAFYREQFIRPGEMSASVHCPSLTELPGGPLLAVWYGGTREGARDVGLYCSTFEPLSAQWGQVRSVTDRQRTQAELGRYVETIGNPAVLTDEGGRTWLFYVSVSVGGWSGSTVNVKTSPDGGQSWTSARRLVLSPFLNVSTLVRGAPVPYADGTIGLPAYHECLYKFPEWVRLSGQGAVLGKTRMAHDRTSLQPSVVPTGPAEALALLRNAGPAAGRTVRLSRTFDAGRSWSDPAPTSLANPDSAVMGLRLTDGTILAAFNDSEQGRDRLALGLSQDQGQRWRIIHIVERRDGPGAAEFSYPCMIQARDGTVHLAYTWNRKGLKHVAFNEAWIRGRP